MIDFILRSTQLPNLHPALIHFPIALLPVALAFDAASLVPALHRRRLFDVATPVLYALTALAAWAAWWSGGEAEHSLTGLPRAVRRLIHEHEEAAETFLWVVVIVAVVRLALVWWERREGRGGRTSTLALRGLVLAGGAGALVLLAVAADHGGGLVYRAGVAVMAVQAPEEGGGGTATSSGGSGAPGTLIVANKAEATVSLLDAGTGEVRATLPTGTGPHEVAVSPDGRMAAIADYGTGAAPGSTLTVIDVPAARVVKTLDLGEHRRPHGMAWYAPDRLYVTSEASQALLEVDPEAGTVRRALETGQELSHMVVVTPDGARAFVANIGSGTVTALDLGTGKKLADVATGEGAEGIAFGAGRVWVANRAADRVSAIDPATLEVVATVAPGTFPIRAEVTPDDRYVLVSNARSGTISVIDAASAQVARTIELGVKAKGGEGRLLEFGDESPVPIGIEIAPDGRRAWVAAANADAIVVLDLDAWKPAGTVTAGREPDGMGYSPLAVRPADHR